MIENQIINKIIDYILSHIEQDISVDEISQFCGYSKFYLSRLFKQETGESIYGFIKRVKVEQSAFRLKVEKDRTVTEIGESYGYSSSNYATLFKDHFNKSPANFRKEMDTKDLESHFETYEECCNKITIENLPDYFVLYERRMGNYQNLKDDWCDFEERYKEFMTPQTILIDRTLDDPSITDAANCMYEVCMTVDKNDPRLTVQKRATEDGPNTMTIEGGKFAVYHYKGYPKNIYSAFQNFFSRWLAESGNRIDSRCGFDIYRKLDPETLYMELDICIPVV